VLDMAGLAGATAHRGVRLIRIPTTVLSQNDSGVGVKNGVNAYGKKNFLGTFAPPYAVVNDSRFLTTLSDRDWRSGIAEAIKVALIKDAAFFEFLEDRAPALASRDMAAMQRLIYRCAELHLQHIATSGDPFELGSARPLDFGHWSAHKLEQLSGYRLRHGEAVAIGLALDTTYSYLSGFIPEADWRRVLGLLLETGFAIHTPELGDYLEARDNPLCLLQGLREFREHLGGELTITLVERIGHGLEVHEIDERLMVESIALLERLGTRFGWDPSDPRPDPAAHPEGTRVPGPPTPSSCRVHVSSEGVAIGHRRRVCRSAERPAGAPPAAGIPAAGVAVCGHPNGTAEKRRIAMENQPAPSPMTRRQLIDEYFIENRTKLLDIAAFLDRLDRAPEDGAETDFRMEAFDEALQVLSEQTVARSTQVQMIFSDPTTEPLDRLDQKSARGAYDRQSGGAR
jgi:3-dehydroquinate synthetase